MQVSQIAELDTHAVIGGSSPQSFFMSDSAEFFTILSNTLYRDKKLAVVREVICNAHDAHVMGNCLNQPIEITLTDEELVIKDCGPGIADDRMHPTYCGYGVSTKVDDATQIGGFGLGCKAPFAYSDHFSVTSCHAGERTVYAISRGGIDSKGKPALHRMIKVPTTETGITVSIPVKSQEDRREFNRLITQVVRNGGMYAKLNDIVIDAYDFTGIEKSGYAILFDSLLRESSVYVRLGSVLYPLTTDDPNLTELVSKFKNNECMKLILSMRPGEVGITPSREALSYSEETIRSLTKRLEKVLRQLCHLMPQARKVLIDEVIKKNKNPVVHTNLQEAKAYEASFKTNPLEIAETIHRIVSKNSGYYSRCNLEHFVNNNSGSIAKAILKAAARHHRDYRRNFRRAYYDNEFFAGIQKYKGEKGRLLIRMASRLGVLQHVARYSGRQNKVLSVVPLAKNANPFDKKPKIVLVRSREQASGYLRSRRANRDEIVFIVVRTLKAEKIEEIRQAAKRYKFELEELDISKPAPKPKKPQSEPVQHSFYELAGVNPRGYQGPRLDLESKQIQQAPVFIECSTLLERDQFRYTPREIIKHKKEILAAYPTVALAIGAAQKKALIEAGSRDLTEVIAEDLLKIQNTPEMLFLVRIAKTDLFRGSYNGDRSEDLANTLVSSDLRFAKFLAGKRVVVSEEEEKIYRLLKLHTHTNLYKDDENRSVANHIQKLRKAAEKMSLALPDINYLKPLCAVYYRSIDEVKWSEDLMETLRFLQRRSVKSRQKQQQPEPVKEAA